MMQQKMKQVLGLLLLFFIFRSAAGGQETMRQAVTMKGTNITLADAFSLLKKQTGLTVFYGNQLLNDQERISFDFHNQQLQEVLAVLLKDKPLKYELRRNQVIVLSKITVPANPLISQQQSISGQVSDKNGPITGVSIRVKGTNRGTATDANGRYTIQAATGEILVFSLLGYTVQEQTVGTGPTLNVVLTENIQEIDEVVVIGYGTVRKSDLTGSVAQVKAKEINAFPNANVLQSLSGRAPGVQIRQASGAPGPSMSVRIRGGNSIQGSNEPLYVIDGFPIQGSPTQVNNSEIESVEILKDASATAIYGSRGANGVVLITTKSGKAGKTKVDFETSFSTQRLVRKLDLMNAREYALFYNEQAKNDGVNPYFTDEQINTFGEGFDWQDFVFKTAPLSNTALNISGGNEKTVFSFGGSIFSQDGIIEGSDYKRYSVQTRINHKISDKFRAELSGTLSKLGTYRKDSEGGNRGNSLMSAAISSPPILTPYNDDGTYRVLHTSYPFMATDLRNPINYINEQSNVTKANVALLNASIIYDITPDLFLKVAGGIENRDDRQDEYTTTKFYNSIGSASIKTTQFTSLLNENTLNYSKTFHEVHQLNAVLGFTYQDFKTTFVSASGTGFLSDDFYTGNLSAADVPGIPSSGYAKSALVSFLGRVNYTYNDKYLFTASLRRDGSSRYSDGDKWGYFPSAAFAWRAFNEPFLKDISFMSDLKLRTSWGLTGSQAIDPYTTLNLLEPGKTIFNDDYAGTFSPSTELPAPLKWETTEQFDVGLDVGFLNNRLSFSADYYVKNTRDLLSRVLLPSSMGYTSTTQNIGKIQNRGFELGLDAKVLNGPFNWDINTNISFNRNKVVKLSEGDDLLRDNINMLVVNDATGILREGRPVGQFWGYVEDGYDDTGNIRYKDLNGDGTISAADKTYIGNANPKFIFGFNSIMQYKDFELNLFFQGSYGNDIFNASSISNTMDYGFGLNMPKEVLNDHWSPENTDAKYPKISKSVSVRASDRFVEDGSYIRLKNIMLSYRLPIQRFGLSWLQNLQVYVSGQNLWTGTKYSWWDPETNFQLDQNSYPLAKSFTFGLRAGF
ncbi:TonB-dependent receptor [Olivibacter ginsenosidimutans]|uniref:TonB-dependent receptor n=1 Tax=Olivibacter ginsenosidimutans TaxID=1176537 RepID=A0ABP9AH07_9SPHI